MSTVYIYYSPVGGAVLTPYVGEVISDVCVAPTPLPNEAITLNLEVSMATSMGLCASLSISLLVFLSMYLPTRLSVCLSSYIYLSVRLSV